jgi:cell fate regulator YaaT (PSP1 superfamily)
LQLCVELRQIGPRDQAGMVGGIGSCGRNICCVSYLRSFVSINVKMAKAQELSLNPSNIIGACGRLKCCLQFEYDGYQSLLSNMPKVGAKCECSGGCGRVVDRNILLQTVTVQLADKRVVDLPAADVTPQAR